MLGLVDETFFLETGVEPESVYWGVEWGLRVTGLDPRTIPTRHPVSTDMSGPA